MIEGGRSPGKTRDILSKPLRALSHSAEGLKQFDTPVPVPTVPTIDIKQHFLSEPVAKKAQRKDLAQIPRAYEIEQYGTFVANPDDLPRTTTETLSRTDNTDKYTHDVDCCLAVVAAGTSKTNGDNVSKLFHITPNLLIDFSFRERFDHHLQEFKDNTDEELPVVIIAGGLAIPKRGAYMKKTYGQLYTDMVKTVREGINEALQVEPVVISPKRENNYNLTHVYYATEDQELIVVETGEIQEPPNQIFPARLINRVSRRWD